MGRKLVSNPIHGIVHYDVPEEVKQKIAALEMQLIQERAVKSSKIKEVIKIEEKIIYQDDPDLLKRFNEAMVELGKFRMSERNKRTMSIVTPETVIQEIPVYRETTKEIKVLDKKRAIAIGAASFWTGFILFAIIEKLIGFPIM
jgi:hypothetical protein